LFKTQCRLKSLLIVGIRLAAVCVERPQQVASRSSSQPGTAGCLTPSSPSTLVRIMHEMPWRIGLAAAYSDDENDIHFV